MNPTEEETARRLDSILRRIAERIVENGTPSEARALQALAAASRDVCPGAAAALVDWSGSEIARLRAFGIVHGVVLRALGPGVRSTLLEQVLGTAVARPRIRRCATLDTVVQRAHARAPAGRAGST